MGSLILKVLIRSLHIGISMDSTAWCFLVSVLEVLALVGSASADVAGFEVSSDSNVNSRNSKVAYRAMAGHSPQSQHARGCP